MSSFDPSKYSQPCRQLIEQAPPTDLLEGRSNESVRDRLSQLDVDSLFPGEQPRDRAMASCCLSALWLLHNFLEQSHEISQNISSQEGSYWHGIMHRREPDYTNAKYWFRRVGQHAIFAPLQEFATRLATSTSDPAAQLLAKQQQWDALRFVDLCQQAVDQGGSLATLCQQLARKEWELLFDYCYQAALER